MTKDIYKDYEETLPGAILENVKKEVEKAKFTTEQIKEILVNVKGAYDQALISPGENIGIVTAESFGEPGTQMSVQSDEKIIIKIKDKIKIVTVGDFIDGLIDLRGAFNLSSHSEVLPISDLDIYVPSTNQEEKIEWKRVVEVSRHNTDKRLIRLVTKSGREITATDNHSFVVRQDNHILPIVGRELTLGQRIPIMNKFNTTVHLNSVSISDIVGLTSENLMVDNGLVYKLKTNAKSIKNSIPLNFLGGWFIGAYLSEGFANGYSLAISNLNDSYIGRAKEFIEQLNLDYTDKSHHRGFSNSRDLVVNSTLLSQFLVVTCGRGADNKRIPSFIYSASDTCVAGLLRAYFDGDGNFHVDRKMIRSSSNSRELRDGIALLLSRFKIFSFKVTDKKGQYWLLIPYKYAPLYLQHVGSDIDYKQAALEELAEKAKRFWNERSQDYTDMISGFGELFRDTAKKIGYPTRYINNFTNRQKIGRTALFRYMKLFESMAKEKNIDITQELSIMQRMFSSDVIWDEIVKIDYVNNDKPVYDLSVPGLETFTTFEGIITHNTLNVFHFAGVSEMQVTEGLPRLIEIFDAREHPNKPIINVYLNKEYTKDDKTIKKVASLIKEIKLEGISSQFSLNLMKGTVEIQLDTKKLTDYALPIKDLIAVLQEQLKIEVKELKNKIVLTPKEGESSLGDVFKLKEKAKSTVVRGIKGITQVLPVRKDNELVILCAGTNFKEVLALEAVDEKRTYTNDIHEIAKVLGIEAARQAIINESLAVIESQGLDIDIRHTLFLSDLMTTTGKVKGITRGGITGEKESVLARATFETPIIHLVNASMIGERDNLNSVIENVIINQPIPLGTGLPGLIAKKIKGGKS